MLALRIDGNRIVKQNLMEIMRESPKTAKLAKGVDYTDMNDAVAKNTNNLYNWIVPKSDLRQKVLDHAKKDWIFKIFN